MGQKRWTTKKSMKHKIEGGKKYLSDREDHYVDAFRYAMLSLRTPKLRWYQRLWKWIKQLFRKLV